MKRTPEFILGLIGGILATVFQALMLVGTSAIRSNPDLYWDLGISFTSSDIDQMFMMYAVAFVASVAAIVFACLVNKKTKLSGIVMIILAVIIELINMLNIVSFILLMISGVMCLARKVKRDKIVIETTTIDLSAKEE